MSKVPLNGTFLLLLAMMVQWISCQPDEPVPDQFTIIPTAADIASFPVGTVNHFSHNGAVYFAQFSGAPVYRQVRLPTIVHGGAAANKPERETVYYCRVPTPLSREERDTALQQAFYNNTALLASVRNALYDFVLQIHPCFEGEGDSSYTSLVHTYKFCPFGETTLTKMSDGFVSLYGSPPLDNRSDDVKLGTHDEVGADGVLIGTYDFKAPQDPFWNAGRERWEWRSFSPGERCRRDASRNFTMVVVFRCKSEFVKAGNLHVSPEADSIRSRDDATSPIENKVIWLIHRNPRSCEVTVELETLAVCGWHKSLNEAKKTPIPCLVV